MMQLKNNLNQQQNTVLEATLRQKIPITAHAPCESDGVFARPCDAAQPTKQSSSSANHRHSGSPQPCQVS